MINEAVWNEAQDPRCFLLARCVLLHWLPWHFSEVTVMLKEIDRSRVMFLPMLLGILPSTSKINFMAQSLNFKTVIRSRLSIQRLRRLRELWKQLYPESSYFVFSDLSPCLGGRPEKFLFSLGWDGLFTLLFLFSFLYLALEFLWLVQVLCQWCFWWESQMGLKNQHPFLHLPCMFLLWKGNTSNKQIKEQIN